MNSLIRLKVINKVISLFDTCSYHKILINMLLDTKMADIIVRNVVETPVFIEKVSEKIKLPYFSDHKTHRTIRRTLIFSFDFLEKNNDECILILVIYWKKTGLVHTKISNHNLIYSS